MQVKINGKSFEVAGEPKDYWGWVADGRFDHEWKTYDAHLKPEHTFIDLGAWVGSHSLYASTIAKEVMAFEPDPVAFEILRENMGHAGFVLVPKAVGIDGEVTLGSGMLGASTTRRNLAAGGGIGEATETCTAHSITLRKLCENIPDPLFIKIDVEGSEEEILKDRAFFKERKPTVFIELHPFWWANESETRKDFQLIADGYKSVKEIRSGLLLLEN